MKAVIYHVKAVILNILTVIFNVFIRRDTSVWIIGGWMGKRFADNSRYLYQYLHQNKEQYGIKKVIWITRSSEIYSELKTMGYTVEMINSVKGIFWHLKSGVHVVCNMPYDNGGFFGDINGNLSYGAKKIQLWHGFPIKANQKGKSALSGRKIHKSKLYKLSLPGEWNEKQYIISISKECSERYKVWFGKENLNLVECGYPRNCECVRYLKIEEELFERIGKYNISILYLPTFRNQEIEFHHPLSDDKLVQWIRENNVMWIEKPHSASAMDNFFAEAQNRIGDNLVQLSDVFDVNVLLPKVTLLITDYSSVSVDAIYFDRPVVYYVPDFETYCSSDRGLTDGFEKVTKGPKAYRVDEILNCIKERLECPKPSLKEEYIEIKELMFDGRIFNYEQQIREILEQID